MDSGKFTQMSGINAIIGLPIIRTSVDHGTAYDKAGKNEAHEGSLVEAFQTAALFAKNWDS
jgi:4-hydroxythreonine-4-phosphate dehydrogenase